MKVCLQLSTFIYSDKVNESVYVLQNDKKSLTA